MANFGDALIHMKAGGRMTRTGWNGKGQAIHIQQPDPLSEAKAGAAGTGPTLPYVVITTVHGERIPWLASQADVLADDWVVAE